MSENADSDLPPGGAADGARIMAVALLLGALALGGWLARDLLSDAPFESDAEESALPELPEPGEARTRAMVSTGEGFGWTWVNPLPRAMPTWYAVDAIEDGSRVAIVGLRGAAVRYEDQAILLMQTDTESTLRGVAWLGSDEVLAVGDDGTMLRLTDGPPRSLEGVHVNLRGVVATGPGQALVVGDEGTILRVGETARALEAGTDASLMAAFSRGGSVFIVGEGTILRVEGDVVTSESSPVNSALRGVGGCANGSVYAVGDRGVVLRRGQDQQWSRLATHTQETFTDVSCDHGRVAAVGADGRVLLISGDETLALPSGFDRPWQAVDGSAEGPTWVVGTGGRLATIEQDHMRTRTAGPAVPIRALGALGGAIVAVGEWGRIIRQARAGFSESESPTEAGLASLIQLDATRLLAIGDFGALVDIRHDRATLLGTPTQTSLRDGVGDAEALLLVGSGGAVLRGPPGALVATVIPAAGDLWAVAGSPTNAVAVGDEGLMFRLNATGFSRIECETSVTLRDVVRLPAGVFAVGDEGTIARIEGNACVIERHGGPSLHAVGLGPEGRVIAAGDQGVVIERATDGEGWSRVGVNVLGASIRTIWRSDRNVYLAGTGGVIVRHILVDGT